MAFCGQAVFRAFTIKDKPQLERKRVTNLPRLHEQHGSSVKPART